MYLFSKSRLKYVWAMIALWVSWLILVNTSIYFEKGPTPIFLLEKGDLRHWPLWRTAFYIHIASACVCLAVGPLLMVRRLIRVKRFHAMIGYVYLNVVLWLAAPFGLFISFHAKGGPISSLGFVATGVLWWGSSWLGYRTIRKGDLQSHICWMLRSYSIALSAVWFRLVQYGLSLCVDATVAYVASVWLSLLLSVWFSEACIHRHFRRDSSRSQSLPSKLPSTSSSFLQRKIL